MKITIDGKSYGVTLAQNALGESIAAMCPMTLTLSRSGNHEYYAALPDKAQTKGAEETSQVKRGGVYYFAAWNAFSLEFIDKDITPYKAFTVGQMEEKLAALLETAGEKLTIIVEE